MVLLALNHKMLILKLQCNQLQSWEMHLERNMEGQVFPWILENTNKVLNFGLQMQPLNDKMLILTYNLKFKIAMYRDEIIREESILKEVRRISYCPTCFEPS